MENAVEDSLQLKEHLNNLISILALPAMWSGTEPQQVIAALLDVLLVMLQLDFIYGELLEPNGSQSSKMARLAVSRDVAAQANLTAKLADAGWIFDATGSPLCGPNPAGEGDVSIARFRLGLIEELGVIVAASRRRDFPDVFERLLLNVAANQAAIWLQEARRLSEQRQLGTQLKLDRDRAEELLLASEARWTKVFENSAVGIALTNLEGRIEMTNATFQQMLGYEERELVKLSFFDLAGNETRKSGRALVAEILAGRRQQFNFEEQCFRKDGSYAWVRNNVSIVPGADGAPRYILAIVDDISDRKLAEESLRQAQARLSRATQVATAAELAAAIAHEINQPLGAVVANAHASLRWLSASSPNVEKAHEAIKLIVRDGNDIAQVVRRTKALFAGVKPVRIALNLNELADEVLRLLQGEISKRPILVKTDLDEELPLVLGDRLQIQQLLLNLVLNAIEATDPVNDREKRILIRTAVQPSSAIRVEVADNGIGLQDPDKAFEAFFTTKESGIGMGLAICRTIVEGHDGELWAKSNSGAGTTFGFTLPAGSNRHDEQPQASALDR
ncbi:MAG TPA: PAS domain S-box protein [Bryobacteraceae bacterium]|jgi:PAS domain S-box-containing protein|nr:PAS domain S-box protein [Bryobacteraceae bacterium]